MSIRYYTRIFRSTTTQAFAVDTDKLTADELAVLDRANAEDDQLYVGTGDPEVSDVLGDKGIFLWDEATQDEREPNLRIYREDQ